jgi:hypothetical protein
MLPIADLLFDAVKQAVSFLTEGPAQNLYLPRRGAHAPRFKDGQRGFADPEPPSRLCLCQLLLDSPQFKSKHMISS